MGAQKWRNRRHFDSSCEVLSCAAGEIRTVFGEKGGRMQRMWLQVKPQHDVENLKQSLGEIGSVVVDPSDPRRLILTFHNQSESGIRMAGFRLSQDFIDYLDDFDMIREG
jgi:hypothetical protein